MFAIDLLLRKRTRQSSLHASVHPTTHVNHTQCMLIKRNKLIIYLTLKHAKDLGRIPRIWYESDSYNSTGSRTSAFDSRKDNTGSRHDNINEIGNVIELWVTLSRKHIKLQQLRRKETFRNYHEFMKISKEQSSNLSSFYSASLDIWVTCVSYVLNVWKYI